MITRSMSTRLTSLLSYSNGGKLFCFYIKILKIILHSHLILLPLLNSIPKYRSAITSRYHLLLILSTLSSSWPSSSCPSWLWTGIPHGCTLSIECLYNNFLFVKLIRKKYYVDTKLTLFCKTLWIINEHKYSEILLTIICCTGKSWNEKLV